MEYNIPVAFHFAVEFDDFLGSDVKFQQVNGLSVTMQTEDYIEGGENRFVHKLPVRTNYATLELKRGFFIDSELTDWVRDALEKFKIRPMNLVVKLLNQDHEPLVWWKVINAYPIEWTIDSFNAEESKLVIESMKLNYQYFVMDK